MSQQLIMVCGSASVHVRATTASLAYLHELSTEVAMSVLFLEQVSLHSPLNSGSGVAATEWPASFLFQKMTVTIFDIFCASFPAGAKTLSS